jgi:hypothetical protein
MNEKIRELAEQAGPNTEEELNDDRTNIYVIDVEKFAELLFNEIANTTVVSDGMFNGNERRLSVELWLGDMVKKISVLGFEE